MLNNIITSSRSGVLAPLSYEDTVALRCRFAVSRVSALFDPAHAYQEARSVMLSAALHGMALGAVLPPWPFRGHAALANAYEQGCRLARVHMADREVNRQSMAQRDLAVPPPIELANSLLSGGTLNYCGHTLSLMKDDAGADSVAGTNPYGCDYMATPHDLYGYINLWRLVLVGGATFGHVPPEDREDLQHDGELQDLHDTLAGLAYELLEDDRPLPVITAKLIAQADEVLANGWDWHPTADLGPQHMLASLAGEVWVIDTITNLNQAYRLIRVG